VVWSCGTFILSGLHCLCEFLQLSGGSFFLLSVVPAKWLIVGHFNWFCYLLAYLLTWHQWAVMWTITLFWCCSGLQTVDCCCSAPVWVKCWSTTQLVKSLSVLLSVSVRVVLFQILLYTQKITSQCKVQDSPCWCASSQTHEMVWTRGQIRPCCAYTAHKCPSWSHTWPTTELEGSWMTTSLCY